MRDWVAVVRLCDWDSEPLGELDEDAQRQIAEEIERHLGKHLSPEGWRTSWVWVERYEMDATDSGHE